MATAADKARAYGQAVSGVPVADRIRAVPALVGASLEHEWAERRFFLWLPVGAGAGVALYFAADREPFIPYALVITVLLAAAAWGGRGRRRTLVPLLAATALAIGFSASALRTASLTHPVLDRIRILKLTGVVEEADHRRTGARFILRVRTGGEAGAGPPLTRVRLTTRRSDPVEAGDTLALTARLVPPARPSLPGGYDFGRDAYFAELDAVGSVLGHIKPDATPDTSSWWLSARFAIDRARNALAARVAEVLDGDVGAIGAAMVTGKRDLLSDDGRELIREAGIFHIITIAGVQMTLVAGLLFGGVRACFAAIPALALRYPIKAWAAGIALVGAVGYDLLTGSRIGTQRALLMTSVMLCAILAERRAFTMRNLALAALAVIAVEPETVLGASFQLSFAAVAALVAVQEARLFHVVAGEAPRLRGKPDILVGGVGRIIAFGRSAARLLVATVAATSCTAPVMATNFHEISPYVVLGNPLTLSVIEFFAVPGALLGSALYPLGLDRFVWHWIGWGIAVVLWVARLIAAAPGATLTVPAFASWTLPCFALATCSAVIWRSPILRLTAVPLVAAGLLGAFSGPRFDLVVPPDATAVAFRTNTGPLGLVGKTNEFAASQWLRADGDGRDPKGAAADSAPDHRCDASACVARVNGGRTLSLVTRPDAFEEDCRRADIVVTPLYAPASCAAELIVDRGLLAQSGALAFTSVNGALVATAARATGENRPWSPAPVPRHVHVRPTAAPPPSGGPEIETAGEDTGRP